MVQKRHRNLQIGDVCLLAYSGKIGENVRYCRVDEVHPDEDGVVRNVTVSLRSRDAREKLMLYRSRKPWKMLVGVKRLLLICPNEEISNCETENGNNVSKTSVSEERRPGSRRENDGDKLSVDTAVCRNNTLEDSLLRRPGCGRAKDDVARSRLGSRSGNIFDADCYLTTPGSSRAKVTVTVVLDADCIIDLH